MNEAQTPPHHSTIDYKTALEAFIRGAARHGVDRPSASLAADGARLAGWANAEDKPPEYLATMSVEERQSRAIKIGHTLAERVFGPQSREVELHPDVEYDFVDVSAVKAGIALDIGSDDQPATMEGYFNNEFMRFIEPDPDVVAPENILYGGYSLQPFVRAFHKKFPDVYKALHTHLTTGVAEGRVFKGMTEFYQGLLEDEVLLHAFTVADEEMQRALSDDDRELLEQHGMSARQLLKA